MMLLEKVTIVVPPRPKGFVVTCPLCVQEGEDDFAAARVQIFLPPRAGFGITFCKGGHELGIERAPLA
jgi:hypothetical protein